MSSDTRRNLLTVRSGWRGADLRSQHVYEQAIACRKALEELQQQSENSADKTMLTLSGRALALSLTSIGISSTGS